MNNSTQYTAPASLVIVYPDGSLEETTRANEFVTSGKARLATPAECASYEAVFARDDARIAMLEKGA